MLSANFKPERTAAALHGFLATAQLSCLTPLTTSNFRSHKLFLAAVINFPTKLNKSILILNWRLSRGGSGQGAHAPRFTCCPPDSKASWRNFLHIQCLVLCKLCDITRDAHNKSVIRIANSPGLTRSLQSSGCDLRAPGVALQSPVYAVKV